MLWIGKSVDDRQPISRRDLQSAITEAVKKSGPDCYAFVDVVIEPAEPKSRLDANWAIKGVRFGRSDREKAARRWLPLLRGCRVNLDFLKLIKCEPRLETRTGCVSVD